MSWPKITKVGTVTIDEHGFVAMCGFEFENCSTCRQAGQLGMAWAMEKLGVALVEAITADAPNLSGLGNPDPLCDLSGRA